MVTRTNTSTSNRRRKRLARRKVAPLVFIGAGGLLVMIAIVLAVSLGGSRGGTGLTRTDFDLPTLDGGTFRLVDHRGQVVLVNFWATWCPPCRAEMPGLDAYYRQHRENGLVMVAINVGEAPMQARAFAEEGNFAFPIALDPDSQVADRFGVTGLPVTLVIDAEGRVAYRHAGVITRDVLDAQVLPLLGG